MIKLEYKDIFEECFADTPTGKKFIEKLGRFTFYTYGGATAYTNDTVQLAYELFIEGFNLN